MNSEELLKQQKIFDKISELESKITQKIRPETMSLQNMNNKINQLKTQNGKIARRTESLRQLIQK